MDDIERLKLIAWGIEGDGTLNMRDRLDREAAAKEERETLALEVRQEAARRRRHRFTEEEFFPGYCITCGRMGKPGDTCGWAE